MMIHNGPRVFVFMVYPIVLPSVVTDGWNLGQTGILQSCCNTEAFETPKHRINHLLQFRLPGVHFALDACTPTGIYSGAPRGRPSRTRRSPFECVYLSSLNPGTSYPTS